MSFIIPGKERLQSDPPREGGCLVGFTHAAFAGDAKPDIVTRKICCVRAPRRGPQIGESRFPAAAAIDALAAGSDTARIPLRRARQRLVEIQAPFPNIAGHVFKAEEARSLRESAYRRGLRITVVHLRIAPWESGARVGKIRETSAPIMISPRIFPAIDSARGEFPFRFRGQPVIFAVLFAEPLAISDRVEAGHIHSGMSLA